MQTRLCYSSTLNLSRASLFTHHGSQRLWPLSLRWSASMPILRPHFRPPAPCSTCYSPASLLLLLKCTEHICPSGPLDLRYYLLPCSPSYLHKAVSSSFKLLIHITLLECFPSSPPSHSLFICPLLFVIALIIP